MRYLTIFLSMSLFIGAAATATAQTSAADSIGATLTLRQAVDIAIRNNLAVNQADLNSQTYKVAYDQSWEYMLPTLGANGSQGINFGRSLNTTNYTYVTSQTGTGSYNLNAGLTIFQGLSLQNGVKAARYNFEASRLDLQNQKDNITLSTLLAYLSVLSARDLLSIVREQRITDTIQLQRLEDLAAAGNLTTPNGGMEALPNLRGQVAQDEINIATAVNTLEAAKISLFQLLNVPYNRDVEYENRVTSTDLAEYQVPSPDSLFYSALRVVPSIQSNALKVQGFEKTLAAARGAYFPTLSFQGNVNSYYNGAATAPTSNNKIPWGTQFNENRSEYVGLYLNLPILNGFRIRNNVRNAKINLQTARITETNNRLLLQQTVELAFQNMLVAFKQFKFYTQQAADFSESFRITNIKFSEGVVTSDVYILAKNRADAADIDLAAARYSYIFRTKVLDYYQGRLTIP